MTDQHTDPSIATRGPAGQQDTAATPGGESPAVPWPPPGFPATGGELAERMGVIVTDWNPRRVVGTMPVDGNRQPLGLLHGGASCVLAETLGSLAAVLNAPGRLALGIEINATHHRATQAGLVTGVCTPVHVGRTLATFQIAITDQSHRPVCTARLTCMFRPALGAGGQSVPAPASGAAVPPAG